MTPLKTAHRAVQEHLRHLRAHHDFTSNNDVLLLSVLWADGPGSPTELAASLGLTAGGITTVLERLELAGLIERRPQADDRRRQRVTLTHGGAALLERTSAAFV